MNTINVLNEKESFVVTPKIDTSIIFVIESSNNILGEYLEALNNYIFEAIHSLIELQKQSIYNIGLQIIEFNEACRLSASCNPGNLKDFYWEGIKNTKPKANIGAALVFLREEILNARNIRNRRLPPIIVFFSTGQSTDNTDSAIEKLNKCKIFKDALKMAISIGDETGMELLSMITGTKEAIFHIEDLEREFRQILGTVPTGTIKDTEMTELPGYEVRRTLNIFYVLDVSGSMSGVPIDTLNKSMSKTIEILKNKAKGNTDAIIKVSVLQFSTGSKWITSEPQNIECDFLWTDLKAGGLTDMGSALIELDQKLSRSAFLSSITGNYLPVIIFMTNGFATDDYSKALAKVRQNKWFHYAKKIGFAIGNNPDLKMITEVVGNSEAVIKTENLDLFGHLIQLVSFESIMNRPISGADIVKTVLENLDETEIVMLSNISRDRENVVPNEYWNWDGNNIHQRLSKDDDSSINRVDKFAEIPKSGMCFQKNDDNWPNEAQW